MSFFNLFGGKTTEIAKETETKNVKIENVEETNKNDTKFCPEIVKLSVKISLLGIENKKLKHELDTLKSSTTKLMKKYNTKKQIKYIRNLSNDKLLKYDYFNFRDILRKNKFGWNILFKLNYETLCHIIIHSNHLDTIDFNNRSFLFFLSKNIDFLCDYPDFLNIIDGKFDLEKKDGNNQRPIHYASLWNHNIVLLEFLVKKGVKMDDKVIDYIKNNVEADIGMNDSK